MNPYIGNPYIGNPYTVNPYIGIPYTGVPYIGVGGLGPSPNVLIFANKCEKSFLAQTITSGAKKRKMCSRNGKIRIWASKNLPERYVYKGFWAGPVLERFGAEKAGKCAFLRKVRIFAKKCEISLNPDFLGQKSPFGPPGPPVP